MRWYTNKLLPALDPRQQYPPPQTCPSRARFVHNAWRPACSGHRHHVSRPGRNCTPSARLASLSIDHFEKNVAHASSSHAPCYAVPVRLARAGTNSTEIFGIPRGPLNCLNRTARGSAGSPTQLSPTQADAKHKHLLAEGQAAKAKARGNKRPRTRLCQNLLGLMAHGRNWLAKYPQIDGPRTQLV